MWVVLLAIAVVGVNGVNTFNNRFKETNDPNVMFLYTFQEGQKNSSATSSNSGIPGLGDIAFNATLNAFNWSPVRQGVHLTSKTGRGKRFAAISNGNLGSSPKFSNFVSEVTFEIWFTPDNPSPLGQYGDIPILIGNRNAVGLEVLECWTANQYFLFQQRNFRNSPNEPAAQYFGGQVNTAPNAAQPIGCQDLSSTATMNTSAANYFVLTIEYSDSEGIVTTTYFYDSVNFVNVTRSTGFWSWLPNQWSDGQLYLSLAFNSDPTFAGKIYMISMWSKVLSAAQVAQNYEAGLPNSVPYYSLPSLNVSGFQQVDLSINLVASDFDDDLITYRLLTLPPLGRGTLYFGQGSTLSTAQVNVPFDGALTFRGDYLGYGSPYSTFQYQALDGTGASNPITTIVTLARVNQAPIANSSATSIRAGFFARVVLGGYDVDSPGLLNAYIISTGNGLRVFNLHDGLPDWQPGDAISSLGTEITGYNGKAPDDSNKVTSRLASNPNAFVVVVQAPTIPQDYLPSGQDVYQVFSSLRFTIADSEGALSNVDATVTVTVLNHLEAVSQNLIGKMDTLAVFVLTGRDYSSGYIVENPPNMIFRIRSLPFNGRLMNPANNLVNYTSVSTGIVLPLGPIMVYQTNPFWAGHDEVQFDVSIQGSMWSSGVTTDLLDMQPIHWSPEISSVDYQPMVSHVDGNAYFQLNIFSHSEIYFPGDLFVLRIEISPAAFGSISMPPSQASLFQKQLGTRRWANWVYTDMNGKQDTPVTAAVGNMTELRDLVGNSDSLPFIQFFKAQPNNVITVGVSVCLFTSPTQLDGTCPTQATPSDETSSSYPPSALTFSIEYSSARGIGGTLSFWALGVTWSLGMLWYW